MFQDRRPPLSLSEIPGWRPTAVLGGRRSGELSQRKRSENVAFTITLGGLHTDAGDVLAMSSELERSLRQT
jgi:hypothetical protein